MKVGERRQQGRGTGKQKTICSECDKEYLEIAWGKKKGAWKRIGLYCPNPTCDYMIKESLQPGEEQEGETEHFNEFEGD